MIAEAAKAKPFAQPGLLHLHPANHLQVAGCDAEQAPDAPGGAERLQRRACGPGPFACRCSWTALPMASRMASVCASSTAGGNSGLKARFAQNPGIGAAVQNDAAPA